MVDKYFCMDYEVGRKYNLYFLSWLENVRYCVERIIPLYHAGQGAESTKARLGATFIPSLILFKHRQPVIDRFLVEQPAVIEKILRYLGFWPAVPPVLGAGEPKGDPSVSTVDVGRPKRGDREDPPLSFSVGRPAAWASTLERSLETTRSAW
jgi:hypothetical protein